jgi:hypothetical protein
MKKKLIHLFLSQVLVPSAGIRGFLDATEFGTWLKYVRRGRPERQNVRHVLLAGQIFYEACRDIRPEEELCLGEREPIQLDGGGGGDVGGGGVGRDGDHKGVDLEDEEDDEELDPEDNGVKCLVCDKIFPDVYV